MELKTFAVPILLGLLVVVSGVAWYLYQRTDLSRPDARAVPSGEVGALVEKVSAFIMLPEGETPTVATVANPAKLKDQPFFENAREGDKVLVYTLAKRVYLYRPADNRIINVAPLSIETAPVTQ